MNVLKTPARGKKAPEINRRELARSGLDCMHYNFRKATRVIARIYDESLEPAGITAAQYDLLMGIRVFEEAAISVIAAALAMERTTLTRNLKLLAGKGYIEFRRDADARKKIVRLTRNGEKKLLQAVPLRQMAHDHVLRTLGESKWPRLKTELIRITKQAGKKHH